MTFAPSAKLLSYVGLGGASAFAAMLLARPDLVALGAPFLVAAVIGLAFARRPRVSVELALNAETTIEGDVVVANIALTASAAIERLDVGFPLPTGLRHLDRDPEALRLDAGERRILRRRIRGDRWGGYTFGDLSLTARDAFGLVAYRQRGSLPLRLGVYPREELVRRTIAPTATQAYAGNNRSRRYGDGVEFAEARAFAPGDRPRRVNWRLSSSRSQLYVNESYAERSADVVLLLDVFDEVRGPAGATLDLVVRGAASLARAYLARRDRVGLVSIGGGLRWLTPAAGLRQHYRIVESVIDTQILTNYTWQDIGVIPPRTLPPHAQVIALSTLLDARAIKALFDLRARGFDLTVVEISPLPYVRPENDEGGRLAYRIWRMERENLRDDLRHLGIAVVTWDAESPLETGVEQAQRFRREAHASRSA